MPILPHSPGFPANLDIVLFLNSLSTLLQSVPVSSGSESMAVRVSSGAPPKQIRAWALTMNALNER